MSDVGQIKIQKHAKSLCSDSSSMEAGTNYSFERFDLHTVFLLMADVHIQRKGDVDSLQ